MRNRYKVLPQKCGTYWHDEPVFRIFSKSDVVMDLVRIDPIFNRDGYYYDRYTKEAFFEFKGEAYLMKKYHEYDYFLDDLAFAEAKNKRLDKKISRAIAVLIAAGFASKKQIKLYELEQQAFASTLMDKKGPHYRLLKFLKERDNKSKPIKPLNLP